MTTTLLNNAPASSFRATPPEGRRWPCAAATIRAVDQQVITSPDSARAAESSLGWDETAGLCRRGCAAIQFGHSSWSAPVPWPCDVSHMDVSRCWMLAAHDF